MATKKRQEANTVDDVFLLKDVKVAREGSLFEGMVFCILESDFTMSEEMLSVLKKIAEGKEAVPVAIKKSYTRDEV